MNNHEKFGEDLKVLINGKPCSALDSTTWATKNPAAESNDLDPKTKKKKKKVVDTNE